MLVSGSRLLNGIRPESFAVEQFRCRRLAPNPASLGSSPLRRAKSPLRDIAQLQLCRGASTVSCAVRSPARVRVPTLAACGQVHPTAFVALEYLANVLLRAPRE